MGKIRTTRVTKIDGEVVTVGTVLTDSPIEGQLLTSGKAVLVEAKSEPKTETATAEAPEKTVTRRARKKD